ncbi:ATP-binding protein [Elizabethkingia anophelis]|nr:ATP-binding protein [Elizabethkingia anophelis]
MTKELFEELIQKYETSTLDFKKIEYDFSKNAIESKKAEFIKDIICFSNTIRKSTSYIIIGIEENNGSLLLHGVTQLTDDSILQQKIKGCVFPIPYFRYYPFVYDNKIFGIIEFPIKKYSRPITPTIKLKGLNPGSVYFRRNSSNDEANSHEVIEINNWLHDIPNNDLNINDLIEKYLLDIINDSTILSKIIIELLNISKKHDLFELYCFCEREIKGLNKGENYTEEEIYTLLKYRTNKVVVSPNQINLEYASFYNSSQILQIIQFEHNAWEQDLLL